MSIEAASYSPKEGIILPIDPPAISANTLQRMHNDGYTLKPEFHVTVVPAEAAAYLTDPQHGMVRVLVSSLVDIRPGFSNTIYEIDRPKLVDGRSYARKALVVKVSLNHLDVIRGVVAKMLPEKSQTDPFWHVTLATSPGSEVAARGIGIDSYAEWKDLQPTAYQVGWQASDLERAV